MHPTEDLIPILKKLRLSGVLESLDLRRRQAVDERMSFEEFLYRLLHDEVERRDGKQTTKSHVAQAIGHRACLAGHNVLYTSAHDMLTQLRAARADDSLDRRMLRLVTPDLLIIDDLGLRPLRHDEPIDLYEVIRQRYERGSTIITSNRAIEEWPPLFGDPLMASAAMDRLLHHCQILELDGNSYRNQPRRPRATPAPPADDEV